MNKKSLLALLLSCMLVLSSCSLIVKDPVVDAQTQIIKVGDKVYTKAEVNQQVEAYHQQMRSMYQQYGLNYDPSSSTAITTAQNAVIDGLVEQAVLEQKAVELGADQLTEEEEAGLKETYENYASTIRDVFFSSEESTSGMTEEEIEAQVKNYVGMYFGVSEESLRQEKITDKLKEMTVKDIAVSDEEVQADFDAKVTSAKETYSGNLSAYGASVNNGETIYYRPAGYRMVKQILLQFSDEDQAVIDQLNTKISNENSTISTLTSSLSGVENLDELVSQVTVDVKPLEIERTVGEAADKAADAVAEAAEAAAETAAEAAETAADAVTETAAEVAENAADAVADAAETVAETAAEVAENAADAVTETAETVAETAAEAAETAADAVTETAETVAETAAEAAEKVTVTVKDLSVATADSLSEDLEESTRTNIRLLAEARARLAVYQEELTKATDAAYANLDPVAAEVKEKIAAGEDWDALVAEYNDDPGMSAGRATAETGYAVCEGFASFDAAFTQAAMALEKVGDVSEPTRGSSNGYYIIKYAADVEEGPVDLSEVAESIRSALLKTKQDSFYDETVQQWVTDAKAVIDRNALKD